MWQLLLLFILALHVMIVTSYNITCSTPPGPNTLHNSNTQLLFLPDYITFTLTLSCKMFTTFHSLAMDTDSTTNGTTPDTVIQHDSSVRIAMTNITNLIITNSKVKSCLGHEYNNATVVIKECTNVQLRHIVIEDSHSSYLFI